MDIRYTAHLSVCSTASKIYNFLEDYYTPNQSIWNSQKMLHFHWLRSLIYAEFWGRSGLVIAELPGCTRRYPQMQLKCLGKFEFQQMIGKNGRKQLIYAFDVDVSIVLINGNQSFAFFIRISACKIVRISCPFLSSGKRVRGRLLEIEGGRGARVYK